MPLSLWLSVTVKLSLIRKESKINRFVGRVEKGTFSLLIFPPLVKWILQLLLVSVGFKPAYIAPLISEKRGHLYCHVHTLLDQMQTVLATHYFALQ